MCLLDTCFREGLGLMEEQIFRISKAAKSELFVLLSLAPILETNLRAEFLDEI